MSELEKVSKGAKMTKVTLEVDAEDVVLITENHGGYYVGYCFACKATGWLHTKYGYPVRAKKAPGLQHKASCPMNDILNDDGTLNIPACMGG